MYFVIDLDSRACLLFFKPLDIVNNQIYKDHLKADQGIRSGAN